LQVATAAGELVRPVGFAVCCLELLGSALDSDVITEPVRAPLIPGMLAVKEAAKAAGELAAALAFAFGCVVRHAQHWTVAPALSQCGRQ
jgi:hypothetical protein